MEPCPLDRSHSVPLLEMAQHVDDCRKSHPGILRVACHDHQVALENYATHIIVCTHQQPKQRQNDRATKNESNDNSKNKSKNPKKIKNRKLPDDYSYPSVTLTTVAKGPKNKSNKNANQSAKTSKSNSKSKPISKSVKINPTVEDIYDSGTPWYLDDDSSEPPAPVKSKKLDMQNLFIPKYFKANVATEKAKKDIPDDKSVTNNYKLANEKVTVEEEIKRAGPEIKDADIGDNQPADSSAVMTPTKCDSLTVITHETGEDSANCKSTTNEHCASATQTICSSGNNLNDVVESSDSSSAVTEPTNAGRQNSVEASSTSLETAPYDYEHSEVKLDLKIQDNDDATQNVETNTLDRDTNENIETSDVRNVQENNIRNQSRPFNPTSSWTTCSMQIPPIPKHEEMPNSAFICNKEPIEITSQELLVNKDAVENISSPNFSVLEEINEFTNSDVIARDDANNNASTTRNQISSSSFPTECLIIKGSCCDVKQHNSDGDHCLRNESIENHAPNILEEVGALHVLTTSSSPAPNVLEEVSALPVVTSSSSPAPNVLEEVSALPAVTSSSSPVRLANNKTFLTDGNEHVLLINDADIGTCVQPPTRISECVENSGILEEALYNDQEIEIVSSAYPDNEYGNTNQSGIGTDEREAHEETESHAGQRKLVEEIEAAGGVKHGDGMMYVPSGEVLVPQQPSDSGPCIVRLHPLTAHQKAVKRDMERCLMKEYASCAVLSQQLSSNDSCRTRYHLRCRISGRVQQYEDMYERFLNKHLNFRI